MGHLDFNLEGNLIGIQLVLLEEVLLVGVLAVHTQVATAVMAALVVILVA